jgi:hypothetical protein
MKTIEISDPEELIKTLNSYPNNYMYRGQSDSIWTMRSTLDRILGSKYSVELEKFESMSINMFQNKFHLYDKTNKKPDTKLEWLSIMQHYGVPTRLLDFSTSPYVALYFALEESSKNEKKMMSIYAVDYRSLMKKTLEYLKNIDKKFSTEYEDVNSNQDKIFEETIDRYAYDILWVTEPQIANLRLDRQSGCFLFSGTAKKSYEELFESDLYKDIDIQKINIKNGIWENLFTLLLRMNINSKTIYGDLEGLSRSIKMLIKAYS